MYIWKRDEESLTYSDTEPKPVLSVLNVLAARRCVCSKGGESLEL